MGLTCLRGNHVLVAHGDEPMQDEAHRTHSRRLGTAVDTHTHTHVSPQEITRRGANAVLFPVA